MFHRRVPRRTTGAGDGTRDEVHPDASRTDLGVLPVLVELLNYQDTRTGVLWLLKDLGPRAASARPALLHLLGANPLAAPDQAGQSPTLDSAPKASEALGT